MNNTCTVDVGLQAMYLLSKEHQQVKTAIDDAESLHVLKTCIELMNTNEIMTAKHKWLSRSKRYEVTISDAGHENWDVFASEFQNFVQHIIHLQETETILTFTHHHAPSNE